MYDISFVFSTSFFGDNERTSRIIYIYKEIHNNRQNRKTLDFSVYQLFNTAAISGN